MSKIQLGSEFVKKHSRVSNASRQLESGTIMPPEVSIIEKTKSKILREIIGRREKNVKRFLKEDLTFEAAIYKEPVHYYSDGQWKDIDNSIIEGKDDENNDVLENKDNNFKVKIAKKAKSNKFIVIKKDKYEVSWGIEKPA